MPQIYEGMFICICCNIIYQILWLMRVEEGDLALGIRIVLALKISNWSYLICISSNIPKNHCSAEAVLCERISSPISYKLYFPFVHT